MSILLPPNWANSNCTGNDPFSFPSSSVNIGGGGERSHYHHLNQEAVSTATFQTPSSADIHVTADHPVYIDKPWTLQYGPCGVSGKKISIPISFITEQGSEANPDSLRGQLKIFSQISICNLKLISLGSFFRGYYSLLHTRLSIKNQKQSRKNLIMLDTQNFW